MQALKLFVAVFAVFAVGSEASRFRRSPTEFDIRLIIESARDISNIVFKHVNAGITEGTPLVDKLLNEMAPEAGKQLKKDLDEIVALIKEEEDRFKIIWNTLVKALDDMKPIKPCSDKYAKETKVLANAVEMQIYNFGQELRKKYEKVFSSIDSGIDKIIGKARTLFDTEVPAIVKCLTKGNKDATKCLNGEIDKILAGITEIATDIVFLATSSEEALKPVIEEIAIKAVEIVAKLIGEGRPIITKISDCVAEMPM